MRDRTPEPGMDAATKLRDEKAMDAVWARVDAAIAPRKRRTVRIAIVIAVCAVFSASGGAVAYASYQAQRDVGHGTGDSYVEPGRDADLVNNQGDLDLIAGKVLAIVDPTEDGSQKTKDGKVYGYGGMRVNGLSGVGTLYWVGPVPKNIRRIVNSVDPSVRVQIQQTTYTITDQMKAAQLIIDAKGSPSLLGVTTYGIGNVPGGGLTVDYDDGGAKVDVGQLEANLSVIAGMPVSVEPGGGPIDWEISTGPMPGR